MLKLGIQRVEDYWRTPPADSWSRLRYHFSRNRISYRLLRTSVPPQPAEIEVFEAVMQQMRLTSGVYRTTYRRRFRNLDPFLNEQLAARFPASAPLRAEDWAGSDCLTSAEWAESLLAAYPQGRLAASDLTLFLVEACLPEGDALIVEADGSPLQYISGAFVVRLHPPEPAALIVNGWLGRQGMAKHHQIAWEQMPQGWLDSLDGGDQASLGGQAGKQAVLRRLPVIHPEAVSLARREPRFTIRRHSAFDALAEPVDVIRTMNIFNRSYFESPRLIEGASAVARSLRPGGVWIVGRTVEENPPKHEVSVFVKENEGFRLEARQGPGSEIEALVLEAGAGVLSGR